MKLIPSQIDRSILVLAILYAMALFVPSAWIAMYGFGTTMPAQICLNIFQAALVTILVVAGTRRRILFAIAAWLSIAIAYVVSLGYNFDGVSDRIVYLRTGQKASPPKGEFLELIVAILIASIVMFAISFALSYFFDRFLGPIYSKSQASGDSTEAPKKKSGRFKVLALLAAPLFLAQLSNNALSGAEWLAVAMLLLIGFGIACRLSFWKGLAAIVAFAAAISFTSMKLLALRMGGNTDANVGIAVMFFAGIILILIPVWILVGSLKSKADRRPGWLSGIACFMLGASAWIYSQYDPSSLFFGPDRFDFAIARSIRKLDTHPNVRVQTNDWYNRRKQCDVKFESEEGVDDFFKTNPLPDAPLALTISNMPANVDLSPLEQLTITDLQIRNSSLSTSQLVSLAKIQKASGFYYVALNRCEFKAEEVQWPKGLSPTFSLDYYSGDGIADGTCAEFFEAVKGQDRLSVSMQGVDDAKDCQSLAKALKSRGNKLTLYISQAKPETAAAIADAEDLSNATLDAVELEGENRTPERSYLDLVLNTEANISALPVESDQLFWDLAFAAQGRLGYHIRNGEVPESPDQMSVDEFRKFHFVYDGSESGQPITKLFLPVQNVNTIRQWEKFPKLRCLSLDRAWMRSNNQFEIPPNVAVNLMPLKGIVELKELYMPSWGQGHDLTLLAGQEKLETLQFTASSKGFSETLFPELKHAILVVDVPSLNANVLTGLSALENLETVTLVVTHQYMSGFNADPKMLKKTFEGMLTNVKVELLEPFSPYIPDDFADHCDRVRDHCRAKYLKE